MTKHEDTVQKCNSTVQTLIKSFNVLEGDGGDNKTFPVKLVSLCTNNEHLG